MGMAKPYLFIKNLEIMVVKGWHLICVQYKHEKRVHKELTENRIESFLPTTTVVRQWSDRKKKVREPLFPNYVFVNIKSKNDFYHTWTLDSVRSFVRFGKEYGKVSQKEIDQLKLMIGVKDLSEVRAEAQIANIGDKFIIESGELKGLECEVYRVDNESKISVRLNSIYQNITASIPSHYLQTAIRIH